MNTGFTFPPQSGNIDDSNETKNNIEGQSRDLLISDINDNTEGNIMRSNSFAQDHAYFPSNDPPVTESKFPVIDIPSPLEIGGQKIRSVSEQKPQSIPLENTVPLTPMINNDDFHNHPKTELNIPVEKSFTPTDSVNKPIEEEYVVNLRQQMATDWKSPSEYALHILFTKFVRHAESKLNLCLQHPSNPEPPIIDILGEGVDPSFDTIIESLGHIARKKPKPVIDAMMFWRKSKSESANSAAEHVQTLIKEYNIRANNPSFSSAASPTTPSSSGSISASVPRRSISAKLYKTSNDNPKLLQLQQSIEKEKTLALQADRKSLISIYILCRVLIEIVKQSPEDVNDDLNDKLEEIIFTQLKTTDPFSISSSLIKSSNWNSFAELLGCMSEKNFLSVSDRFIADLEKMPSHISEEMEPNIHLLILGMRYIRLKNYPLDKFEETADFIKSLSKFFARTESLTVRLAYAEVINQLLLPLAGSLSAEVNHPTWIEAMELLLECAKKLKSDSKYWANGFKLMVSILCASPPSIFTENWINIIEVNASKIKTKNLDERIIFSVGLSRLVWVYLYRCPETLNNTTRTLTELMRLYLPTKKKENWLTTDLGLINPLTDALVSIGFLHPTFLVETALIPLLRQSFNGTTLENVNYDRLILAINTYKGLLMTTERPNFPQGDSRYYEVDLNSISAMKNETLVSYHEEICAYLNRLFLLLDSNIGSEVWSPENLHLKHPSTTFGAFSFGFNNESDNNIQRKNLNILLFATIIETIPCCMTISKKISYKSSIEILSRNAVHANLLIENSCKLSLKALASKKNPYTFITWFAKYSFDFDEKTQSSYNTSYLASNEYKKLLELYVELLECWLEEFQSYKTEEKKKVIGLDGIQLMKTDSTPDDASETERLEWKNTITVIEEIEGNGLFFLCSHDVSVRKLAIQILKIISRFDEAMVEKTEKLSHNYNNNSHSRSSSLHFAADRGNRLIDLLNEANIIYLIGLHKASLSVAEKSRLSKLNSRYRKGLLINVSESSYGVDGALWQRAFPKLLISIFKSCPMTMALCRSLVCIRLVQMHEIVLRIANDTEYKPSRALPETIIHQWKLYLVSACTSLTSTNDQKLHIPVTIKQHGRKKSQQIFTVQHQKIKSARSIFKMVLPLLSSKHPIIKEAIISGLSSMNINIYKTFIESIDHFLISWKDGNSDNQKRVEMFHILTILSRFLKESIVLEDDWILRRLSEFLRHTKTFLEQDFVQVSFEYQQLRSYFAELLLHYYSAIREHPLMEELFPFEARVSSFNYLKYWCGYGEYASISTMRYAHMINNTESNRDKTAITAGIEFQKNRLETIILEAMVILCSDPITKKLNNSSNIPVIVSFDIKGLLSWIESLFNSQNETVKNLGVRALENLLEKNRENSQLFKDVAVQCISQHDSPSVAVLYYITLCKSVLNLDDLILDEDELVSLGLYGLVSDKEDTRTYAVDLLSAVETKLHNSSYTKVFKERLANSSKSVYKSTAKEISTIFAELLSQELCLRIFSSLVRILDLFPFEIKRDLLVLMVPWVNKFTMKSIDDLETYMVLNNLFHITIDLNNRLPKEVEQIWISLGKGNSFQNTYVSLEYIIETAIQRRNPAFVQKARDVVLYLANVPGSIGLLDTLLDNLEPKSMIPNTNHNITGPVDKNTKDYFIANIWERLNYTGKQVVFSKAQLSIIFLVNLLTDANESVKMKLPTLLHISICLLDHYIPLVQESASRIICNLIFGLSPTHEKSESTVNILRNKQLLWSYDNLVKDKKGARSPKSMDPLVRNIISIFAAVEDLQNLWQKVALKWATTCSVRHIACRSFQVFRSLLTFIDQDMLRDMLHRLSNTISDDNPDIQGFAMQILMTLNAIMAELDSTDLISFPQLFWSIIACMSSVHEQEFIESLSCVTKFISKIDLDSPDTVQCLVATFPSNWEGRFDGLQQITMTGLRSSNSLDITLKCLDKLNLLKDSRIIADPESRLFFALIANLPRFLNAMDHKDFLSIQDATKALIVLSDANNQPSLSRLIDSLAKDKFRSKKDFMSQVVSFISRNYFPQYSAQALIFLLGLLLNELDWIKIQTMEILKYVFPLVDLTRPEFTGVGADLISPLLRLLLTSYEMQALEVLDYVPNVSGSKMDKDVLRISMGNNDVKNNSTVTTTLFGLPEESGWSIPMPTMTAATTRHNVHTVFMSCKNSSIIKDASEDQDNIDEIVEFHADGDYALGRIDTVDSFRVPEEEDASLSHMWAELDNLDSFFTKETSPVPTSPNFQLGLPHDRSDSIDTTNTDHTLNLESAPQLYDKKVSVILNRSLSRTPSSVSFKKYLADSFATNMSRDVSGPENNYQRTSVLNNPLFYRGSEQATRTPTRSSAILSMNTPPLYSSVVENKKSTKSANRQGRHQKHYHLPRF
ncbi:hypothetical protein KAFR_0J01700 [Kazachstania africana CBS 2517]|uniref:Cell morphogenesis protein PAG1 n=1 Tax=Kazachstania africana (strain ATCC 22294 / BCRC 22015 / CBS 2517 / CECT 1963 / NBRC 1671 / NRRL Y-8276) TaxID=1071382 RepID=H2B0T4_KAZAF|nr:hypothetical protein KAFR_0J01700 [Kazachstania africana CBS 2517]CCF60234.1 hypothetical protein KAFR_0J01700 [Kazachstania africana CBS 2517]